MSADAARGNLRSVLATLLATVACGLTPTIDGARYDVHETHGHAACSTIKPVVTRFLRNGTQTHGWTCFLGHDSSPYAASCARGKSVTVRVYAPS